MVWNEKSKQKDKALKNNADHLYFEEIPVDLSKNSEGLPGVLGNKETSPFTFREQGIFQNNF